MFIEGSPLALVPNGHSIPMNVDPNPDPDPDPDTNPNTAQKTLNPVSQISYRFSGYHAVILFSVLASDPSRIIINRNSISGLAVIYNMVFDVSHSNSACRH